MIWTNPVYHQIPISVYLIRERIEKETGMLEPGNLIYQLLVKNTHNCSILLIKLNTFLSKSNRMHTYTQEILRYNNI